MAGVDALQQRWYQPDRRPPWWTLPLAALYGAVTRARRACYRNGWCKVQRLPVPVIVVGNIVAGGAGKTPLVITLVEALRARGYRPGVVSRGHGGRARTPQLLGAVPDPALCGDEPALIRLRTGVPVAVGVERPAAARLLLAEHVDVIVADDGLQHYALGRDVEVCVIDGVRRLGNARLLPAGPLREAPTRLREVDFVVCNGGAAQSSEVAMQLAATAAVSLASPSKSKPLADFRGQRVHAIAGIGHPQRFFATLQDAGLDVIAHAFADHHAYVANELAFGDGLPVLMTEKDAVKCHAFAQPGWWSVPVTAELPNGFIDAVVAKLAASHTG